MHFNYLVFNFRIEHYSSPVLYFQIKIKLKNRVHILALEICISNFENQSEFHFKLFEDCSTVKEIVWRYC